MEGFRPAAKNSTRAACAPQSIIRVILVESQVPILLFGFESSKRLGHEFAGEFGGVWRTGD